MRASDLEVLLLQALDALANCHPDDLPGDLAELADELQGARVRTFSSAGLLTRDRGVLLSVDSVGEDDDDDEGDDVQSLFQITIVEA